MSDHEQTKSSGAAFTCLIVEDDPAFAATSSAVVRNAGGAATACGSLAAASAAVARESFDLVLLDNHLPDGKGYDFFAQLSRRNPDAPVVMITGMPDLGEAISLTRNGLFDYLTKPVTLDALEACLRRALLRLRSAGATPDAAGYFGESPAMREVVQQLRQAARHTSTTVLLSGETGVGKDVAARALHELSFPAGNAPFIAVNCAAVPADMFESELFGAERGAFTGADRRRAGLVAAASGGTLFLDEIAEVPLALQGKLLRLLEGREYRALGSTDGLSFTGRFVAATNKSLKAEVEAGRFREDLLFRLDVFAIELPPLRRRRADIPGLAEALLTQLARKYERAKPLIKPESLAALGAHEFPGNVRELRNVLERALLRTNDEDRWLALDVNWLQRSGNPASPASGTSMASHPDTATPAHRQLPPIEAQEYRLIGEALIEAKGGIRRAASKLGMSPQALLRRLEKWPELRPPADAAGA